MSYDKQMAEQERPSRILLHHSGNDVDTIAGIISYHRSKWLDVGYNWLIRKGTLVVGRAMKYVGAHSKGANDGTIGICMVGNYMHKLPDQDSIDTLVRILAEQCFIFNIDTEDIEGHRDVGNTDCPGDCLYDFIPEIRKLVEAEMKKEAKKRIPKIKKEKKDV